MLSRGATGTGCTKSLGPGSRTPYALTGAAAVLAVLALARPSGVAVTCHVHHRSISVRLNGRIKPALDWQSSWHQNVESQVDLTVPRAEEGLGACALDAPGPCTVCGVRGGLADDPGLAWNPGGGVAVTAATLTATAFGLGLGDSTTRALVGTASASCRKSPNEMPIHRSLRSLTGIASLPITKG